MDMGPGARREGEKQVTAAESTNANKEDQTQTGRRWKQDGGRGGMSRGEQQLTQQHATWRHIYSKTTHTADVKSQVIVFIRRRCDISVLSDSTT